MKKTLLRLGLIAALSLSAIGLVGCGQPVKQGEVGVKVVEVGHHLCAGRRRVGDDRQLTR